MASCYIEIAIRAGRYVCMCVYATTVMVLAYLKARDVEAAVPSQTSVRQKVINSEVRTASAHAQARGGVGNLCDVFQRKLSETMVEVQARLWRC